MTHPSLDQLITSVTTLRSFNFGGSGSTLSHPAHQKTESLMDNTAKSLKSLAHQLSVTLFNINDMQAAALYIGKYCIARSDAIPVSAIEAVYKSLSKHPSMTSSVVDKRVRLPVSWSVIDAEVEVEFGHE